MAAIAHMFVPLIHQPGPYAFWPLPRTYQAYTGRNEPQFWLSHGGKWELRRTELPYCRLFRAEPDSYPFYPEAQNLFWHEHLQLDLDRSTAFCEVSLTRWEPVEMRTRMKVAVYSFEWDEVGGAQTPTGNDLGIWWMCDLQLVKEEYLVKMMMNLRSALWANGKGL
ncbi:hypothetical protein PLICRDRAFT_44789 [Plicaturopsis crispa FD-325 SS-3]|nr:hypothetical protein PLICRDRAFT_44789 [Plicaturopsis crispa FD-325 SS-3]